MKRWNGWGEETITAPLSATATAFLQHVVGVGTPPHDATLEEVVANLPVSRLPAHSGICSAPIERIRHARGQSLPDWIALRGGCIDAFPDGVAYPESESEVHELMRFAGEVGAHLIPYGGGTSVVGHITPLAGETPSLTVDVSRLSRLLELDETNHLATFGAGITGLDLESYLRAHGFTLGHFPQSFEYSTLGGWIATRSSGQQSLGYGRIEAALRANLLEEGERVHASSHLSHVYPHGSAIYTTYLFRLAPDPQETLRRWQRLKGAASQAIVAEHGTISHQHGIGTDHQPYLVAEKGELGLHAMRQLYAQFDPKGIMNPGKLVL